MKLTVYIVDDEPMAIRYLEMLLHDTSLDVEVVGTASNGVGAVPEIIRLQPDFVFADISMPVMNGLQMASEVLRQNPTQKIFILTAYRDFEYAKTSVSIGVTDYLLKNELSEKSLEELLRKHAEELQLARQRKHTVLETNLRNFFLSDTTPGQEEEWLYKDRPLQRYLLLYLAPRTEILLRHKTAKTGDHLESYQLENEETPPGILCRAFVEVLRNEYCGIFFVQKEEGDIEHTCVQMAESLINRYPEILKDFVCIVSSPFSKFSILQEKYQYLKQKKEFLYRGKQNVYRESEIVSGDVLQFLPALTKEMLLWQNYLEEGDEKKAEQALKEQFSILRTAMEAWRYSEHIREICYTLEETLRKKKLDPDLLGLQDSYTDAEKLEKDLLDGQQRYMESLQNRRAGQYSRHVILAQEFIRNYYRQDISTADIAKAADISEGHLRRCFKNELHINLVNYLTDYRIECAKKIMKTSRKNIDEIWRKTGFTSGQYFSYVFKRKEGITPREYMRKVNKDIDG